MEMDQKRLEPGSALSGSNLLIQGRPSCTFALSKVLSRGLCELTEHAQVRPVAALLAVFALLVQRYSDQQDEAGDRRVQEVGPWSRFVRTLRVDLSEDPSFIEFLSHIGSLVRSEVDREPNTELLGEVLFILPNELRRRLVPSRAESNVTDIDQQDAQWRLILKFSGPDYQVTGILEYTNNSLVESDVRYLTENLNKLVEKIIQSPAVAMFGAGILAAVGPHEVSVRWRCTDSWFRASCVQQLFEEQVKRAPNAVALVYASQRTTYFELNSRANRLAHYLRKRGVGPEVLVGVCIERSIDAVVALIGILKAGGAYVPLNPESPPNFLEEIIEDSRLTVIVTTAEFVNRIGAGCVPVVCLDADSLQIAAESPENPIAGSVLDNVAYVMYTSGSTGKPKGVLGVHRSLTDGLIWSVPFEEDDIFGLRASLSFGGSLALFVALASGVPVVLIPDEQVKDPRRLVRALEAGEITRIYLMPVLESLLSLGEGIRNPLGHLRIVGVGGAPLTKALVTMFAEILPHAKLMHYYASTEIGAAAMVMTGESLSQGKAVADTAVYVLDRNMLPVAVGVVGELYVRAEHLARGYLGRADLTAERFLPNPFATGHGERLYKTGDRGRFLTDGTIELLGREDLQVKIRGFRIEPGEIEAALEGTENVGRAAVKAQDINGSKRLVAYVVARRGAMLKVSQLREQLSRRLPPHMVPAVFVTMERLPLTETGKIDRPALPLPDPSRPELDAPYEEPSTQTEVAIADIWRQVLNVDRVGIHDSFLELGGDSLMAVNVMSGILERFGIELPVTSLFDRPTVAELARELVRPE